MSKMSSPVELYALTYRDAHGVTSAMVAPAWGANVLGLSFQVHDWAWPMPILEAVDVAAIAAKPTSYGVPILAPTPGRVGRSQSGLFRYAGKDYSISPTRHGFLRNMPWRVTRHSASQMRCVADVGTDPSTASDVFPFRFHTEYDLEVGERTLRCRLRIQSTADYAQPIDVGWHPYLHRSRECTVRLPAGGRWELDNEPEATPTGRVLPVEGRDDFREGRLIDTSEHWDDIFTDLTYERGEALCWAEERTQILLKSGRTMPTVIRRCLTLRTGDEPDGSRRIENVQLYTPPGRNAITIEPLSATPNAINLVDQGCRHAGICDLESGQVIIHEIVLGIEQVGA